jgi:DNA-binding MarR family transcriptional regulator
MGATMKHTNEDPRKFTIGHLLGHVCRLMGHRRRMKLESIGLHPAQGMILFRLWKEEGIPQRALAQAMHITPPTACATLQRMERDGWIERRRDELDQRVLRVYLTDAARRLRQEAKAMFAELDKEMTSLLTEQEHKILKQSLLKVHNYLLQTESAGGDRACLGPAAFSDCKEKRR